MQVTRQTWSYVEMVLLGHKARHGKDGNIHVGVAYLRQLLHEFHFNVRLAVGAYNEGPAAVRAHGLYPKTRKFVANVLSLPPLFLRPSRTKRKEGKTGSLTSKVAASSEDVPSSPLLVQ
jgi:hypothetical protein